MVKAKMYREIQTEKKKGKSKGAISRELKIDPKTVKKYYEMTEEEFQKQLSASWDRAKLFDPYQQEIVDVYELNDFEELNMCSVYDFLEEKFSVLPGTEKSLRNYIKYLRNNGILIFDKKVRYYQQVEQLPLGKQAQLDFGEYKQRNGIKLYIFAALLSSSRFKYTAFQERPFKTIDVINHLLDCFSYFGGVPEELVIDQDKVMVVCENYGDIIYTKDFQCFLEEQQLKMYVCRKADPESKGKVENQVKYIKQNFLQTRVFATIREANESSLKWLERRANGKISQATRLIPSRVIIDERAHLRELKNSIFRKTTYLEREERTANDKAVVSVAASRYQLPYEYRNRMVEIYETEIKLFVYDQKTHKEIISYDKSAIPGTLITSTDYRRDKSETIEALSSEIESIYPWPNWQKFVQVNLKAFPRYRRDQLMLARKYFRKMKNTDEIILKEAIEFCFSAETFSFAKLYDTYSYFTEMHSVSKEIPDFSILDKLPSPQHTGIPVQKTSIDLYASKVSMASAGGQA